MIVFIHFEREMYELKAIVDSALKSRSSSSQNNSLLEVEARIPLGYGEYLFFLGLLGGVKKSVSLITRHGNIRKEHSKVINKEREGSFAFNNINIVVSTETEIVQREPIAGGVRETRTRVEFPLGRGVFLHLNRRETQGGRATYDIEIESVYRSGLVDVTDFWLVFSAWYYCVYKVMKSSLSSIIGVFNGNSGGDITTLSGNVIARPRNFKMKDFGSFDSEGVYKGNPFDKTRYSLTVKGNGIQRTLVVHDSGIWWIGPKESTHAYTGKLSERSGKLGPTIIVGEYIKGARDMFIPFDFLFDRGMSLSGINHDVRMKRLADQESLISTIQAFLDIRIIFKEFIPVGDSPEEFAKAYSEVRGKNYPFDSDGMILTPIDGPHNPRSGAMNVGDSILSVHVDLCKIKPHHELTIDVIARDGNLILNSVSGDVAWKPKGNPMVINLPPDYAGEVIEVGPEKRDDGWDLSFRRYRKDKEFTNSVSVADDVWKDILNPIDEETLRGEDFKRLFQYSNVIKRNLIGMIPHNAVVLDIGSGRGGDIGKFQVKHVIAVEPNEGNREELLKRLKSSRKDAMYTVLDVGGEDTEKIVDAVKSVLQIHGDSPLYITSMLSLSFFWRDGDLLGKFNDTLVRVARLSKSEVKFIYYTIDGGRTKTFLESGTQTENFKKNVSMSLKDGGGGVSLKGTVNVSIANSIVENQDEYLVDLRDLTSFESKETFETNRETYLTEAEKTYQSLFIAGTGVIKR